VNSTLLFGNGVSELQANILGEIDEFIPNASSDAGVIAGYKAIYNTTANNILTSPVGMIELLLGMDVDGAIRITAALQHPFSNGQIYINSSNPMDYPIINPNYLTHPAGTFLACCQRSASRTDISHRRPDSARGSQARASPG
jgi:choline dehydrogenase